MTHSIEHDDTPDRTRRACITGAVAFGGTAAALAAVPAKAQGSARAPMNTPITEILYEEDVDLLTDKAKSLDKGDLLEMARLSRGDKRLADGNPQGLSQRDLDSVEEAFWMFEVRDHNLEQSSLLPGDGGLVTPAHAEASAACCCCCAAVSESATSGCTRID